MNKKQNFFLTKSINLQSINGSFNITIYPELFNLISIEEQKIK